MFHSNACEKLGRAAAGEIVKMKNSSAEMPSVPSRLPSGMEPFNNPTYHHYRSAGTLFFNTQDNDLINYQQKQRRNHNNNHSGSVPNIAEYSVGKSSSRSENLQRRRSMSSHDIIDYSPPSRPNNGGSTSGTTSSRSHIYNTIGNFPNHHQPFPKLIQVTDFFLSFLKVGHSRF